LVKLISFIIDILEMRLTNLLLSAALGLAGCLDKSETWPKIIPKVTQRFADLPDLITGTTSYAGTPMPFDSVDLIFGATLCRKDDELYFYGRDLRSYPSSTPNLVFHEVKLENLSLGPLTNNECVIYLGKNISGNKSDLEKSEKMRLYQAGQGSR